MKNPVWSSDIVVAHSGRLARSFRQWTGRDLLSGASTLAELAQKLFVAPFVVVSHGDEADPVLNYGNATALALWEMSWEEFTRTPSRLTAEAPNRRERARLLETVARRGFIEDYSGIRISKTGRRFRIARAIVWNVPAEAGQARGQAAMFDQWRFIRQVTP
ncbi:MAG: MEKHLA domain-containing protein [Verrucomicrobiota bacterium]|nr:MEKHLA domain-containing protein [Verrucomicrobiota bacterium]